MVFRHVVGCARARCFPPPNSVSLSQKQPHNNKEIGLGYVGAGLRLRACGYSQRATAERAAARKGGGKNRLQLQVAARRRRSRAQGSEFQATAAANLCALVRWCAATPRERANFSLPLAAGRAALRIRHFAFSGLTCESVRQKQRTTKKKKQLQFKGDNNFS